jgi:hypothetical protein
MGRRAHVERLGHRAWAELSQAFAVTPPPGVELHRPARVWRDGVAIVAFEVVDRNVVLHRWSDVELHAIIGPHPQDAIVPEVTDPHHVVLFSSATDPEGLPEPAWDIVDVRSGTVVCQLAVRLGRTPPVVVGDVVITAIGDYNDDEPWELVGYDLRSSQKRWERPLP